MTDLAEILQDDTNDGTRRTAGVKIRTKSRTVPIGGIEDGQWAYLKVPTGWWGVPAGRVSLLHSDPQMPLRKKTITTVRIQRQIVKLAEDIAKSPAVPK